MSSLKKAGKALHYLFCTVVPNLTFVVIFVTFMVTIISRYLLKTPIAWAYEISILAYMWTMFFGVGKAMAADEHVVFGLVYDSVGPVMKQVFRISSNLLLIVLLIVVFIPSVNSLISKRMVTGVLKLPFSTVFAPILFMFADIIVRSVIDLKKNIRILKDAASRVEEVQT